MTNEQTIKNYHAYLCETYCELSHSQYLALGNVTTRTVEFGLFNLTPELLEKCTTLQLHSSGQLRLRMSMTNSEFYRLCKRYSLNGQTMVCSRNAFDERKEQLIKQYSNVKAKTFNNGVVFESVLADYLRTNWKFNPTQKRFDLESDLETVTMNIQCKLTNASISESSILNALHDKQR